VVAPVVEQKLENCALQQQLTLFFKIHRQANPLREKKAVGISNFPAQRFILKIKEKIHCNHFFT
jgi:hypothetical protein